MRLIGNRKRFSIFSKLVLAFLVVITPIYLLGAYINDEGARIVDREISKSLQQQVRFYLTSLETEIERMTVLQREFMNDEDLEALSMMMERMTTYERLTAMKRLQKRLSLIKASSMYISEARAYIPSVARIISSDPAIDRLDQLQIDQLKKDILISAPPFILKDNEIYIREYYPSPYNLDTRNPNFVLEIQVSISELHRFLAQLPGYENGGAVMIHEHAVIVSDKHATSFNRISDDLNQQLVLSSAMDESDSGDVTQAHTERISLQGEDFLTVHLYSPLLNSHMVVYVPEIEVMGPIVKYRTYMWLISGISLFVIIAFAYWIYRIIHQPLRKLVGAFRKVESGIITVNIKHNSNDEFHYLYERFNYMAAHLNNLIYEVYEQKIHLQQSELKQLQSQINPHFLYNSFYLLYRMTKAQDVENATRFTMYLGDYYQYITRNGNEEVRLEEELRHVRAYTEIQSIRFNDRIRVTLDELPDSYIGIQVPRLILQPIVENAYQHGFDLDIENCHLQINFSISYTFIDKPILIIVVKDNGIGMTDEELESWHRKFNDEQQINEVTGMLNVHRRLWLKYGTLGGIHLDHGDSRGLIVTLRIPILNLET